MLKSTPEDSKRVLLVDDDPHTLLALARLFRKTMYQIKCAHDGDTACDFIEQWKPQLLILDVLMPGLNGYGVLEKNQDKIKAKKLHVVLLTGKASDSDILKGYAKGAGYYITKPFKNRYVTNIVDYLIGDLSEEKKTVLELQL